MIRRAAGAFLDGFEFVEEIDPADVVLVASLETGAAGGTVKG
jgi:hypothetical protein